VYFNTLVEQLVKNPSRDCPPGNDPSKREQTYDGMIGDLLRQVGEIAKKEGAGDEEKLGKVLARELEVHVKRLGETIEKDEKELEREEKEQKKHITSDDLHEGFENKVRALL
jgi:cell division cycle protein 37